VVPVANPEIVTVAVEPKIAPGFIVQLPNGNPLKVTLPVEVVQVGCAIESITGAPEVTGCAIITTLAEAKDVQFVAFVTV
jgi:hypothetical protein